MCYLLEIKYKKDLKNKVFLLKRTKDDEEITKLNIKNPISTLDSHKLKKIESGRTILNLYENKKINTIIVKYNNCENIWTSKYNYVFPPNLDTLSIVYFLIKNKKRFSDIKSVAEIGCGQGFICQNILKNFRGIEDIYLIDINKDAINLSLLNLDINFKKNKTKVDVLRENVNMHFRVGDSLTQLPKDRKFDLIVSNPPYVPITAENNFKNKSYFGTSLLMQLIKESKNFLKKRGHLIINYSIFNEKDVSKAIANSKGKIVTHLKKDVLFSIPEAIKNKKLIDSLLKKGLKKKGENYMQEIHIVDIAFPS